MSFAYVLYGLFSFIFFHYSFYTFPVPFDDFNFLPRYTSTFNFMIDTNALVIYPERYNILFTDELMIFTE